MKISIKYITSIIVLVLAAVGCNKQEYHMGELIAPSEVTITANIVGMDVDHPNGDGSGDVEFLLSGQNVLSYMIDFDASDGINFQHINKSQVTRKYTGIGLNNYTVTLLAYGPGATSTVVTKEIQVRSDFTPEQQIIDALTGTGSKTWKVNPEVAGHFGVGPWDDASTSPEWWSAAVREKVNCCNCFYTASFTFTKTSNGYSLTTDTPDGAFTKTGGLAGGLPGIPSSGEEGCYSYSGGSSTFSFVPSSTGVDPSTPSTKTSISLAGNETFIGYGAVLKEYEILTITPTELYLRVQGTETGNAWYIRLVSE
ncbi:MAG TPA: hypothetical protein VKZ54_13220 [Membranihabitans sp.]|nr:hypothetical protein [Membranihabitans sp.]